MNHSYQYDEEFYDDDVDTDLCQDEDDTEMSQRLCHCSNCMDCLGMSWRDFM